MSDEAQEPSAKGLAQSDEAQEPSAKGLAQSDEAQEPSDLSGPSPRLVRFVLAASVFILGGCGLAYEYVLGALGNHLMGSSHEQIFVVIGLMLFTMGLGAHAQRYVEDRLFDRFLWIEIILGLVGGFSANAIHASHAFLAHYLLVLYALVSSIGFLIGLEIPLILRLNADYGRSLRVNLSEILALDYLGALIGALVFTYGLLTHFSLARIGFILGLTNLLVAGVGLWAYWSLVERRRRLALGLVLSTGLLLVGYAKADDWTRAVEQRYYRDPISLSQTTRYQHIVITEKGSRVNLYLNGHLQFSSLDEHIYHELLVHTPMALARSRKRVLILGGGDGLAVREVLRWPDVEEVLLVELDPQMTALARENPELRRLNHDALHDARVLIRPGAGLQEGAEESSEVYKGVQRPLRRNQESPPRAAVKLLHIDADRFLEVAKGHYDVALLDFPDPSRIEIAKLYSTRFYGRLRGLLSEGAMVSVQSTSPYFARDAFLTIGATLRAAGFGAMPYHAHIPSFGEWGFYIAWADPRSAVNIRASLARIREDGLPKELRFLSPEALRAAFVFGRDRLKSPNEIRPSTLLDPSIIHAYKKGWDGADAGF